MPWAHLKGIEEIPETPGVEDVVIQTQIQGSQDTGNTCRRTGRTWIMKLGFKDVQWIHDCIIVAMFQETYRRKGCLGFLPRESRCP